VVRTSYGLGQTMFTPAQLSAINPPENQRPYAGFLFGEFDIIETNEREQNAFGVQLGIIGPASIAEDAQKLIHAAEGRTKPLGWNTQLRDEPGLVFTFEHSTRFVLKKSALRDLVEIEPHFGSAVGNVYDYANAGAAVRLGFDMPDDYILSPIEPSVPGAGFFKPVATFGAYIFASIDERGIARNIFLDGNSFQASRHVDKETFVNDVQYGAVMALDRYRLSVTHTLRSREFETQPAPDEFTTFTLSARF
jgi:lipid A 3-O-deacylase